VTSRIGAHHRRAVRPFGDHDHGRHVAHPPQPHHDAHLVEEVAAGLARRPHDVRVDEPAAVLHVVGGVPGLLDDELGAVVVQLDVPQAALGADPAEQGAGVRHDAGADLAL
jgi:hypothetical protein